MIRPQKGIAVDGACSPNPGPAEYQCVDLETDRVIFAEKIGKATNNIAEFIGLVHAIRYVQKNNLNVSIWTDSTTAKAWVRKKKSNSTYSYKGAYSKKNKKWYPYLKICNKYLQENEVDLDMIKKWQTKMWGEIPADFGRK